MDEVLTAADVTSSSASSSASGGPSLPTNLPLISAFLAFAVAQFLKLFTNWFKEKRWDSKQLIGSGGMPSSHSATVAALAVAIGFEEGTRGSSFALAVVLAAIVMYDASGIRLHAGRQAELLNQIVCEFPPEHPLSTVRPLRELLGHTPLQLALVDLTGGLSCMPLEMCQICPTSDDPPSNSLHICLKISSLAISLCEGTSRSKLG